VTSRGWGVALALFALSAFAARPFGEAETERVRSLRILILSTMLAEEGIGEWGFAALVEADGRRILFDTGARPETVLQNARELGVDLSDISDVVLSHNHSDHVGGLLPLRRELSRKNRSAVSRAHVAPGIFWSRPAADGRESNAMLALKAAYETEGGRFVEHAEPFSLSPGVWLTGPVPRIHPERNWSVSGQMKSPSGLVEDTLPEDQSLVFDTERGLVLLSGCGHAGIINTIEQARSKIRNAPLHAAIGGFHLFAADDPSLEWTAAKLREFGLGHFIGAHCTGIEAVFRIREGAGLERRTSVVGAVGASFTLGEGIQPLRLAR
jgi:7,8-dihydropterin-6-yl-methyl-4-(beta-D-ribofuranosyl)aminobenzene 5'-phosphate synthase